MSNGDESPPSGPSGAPAGEEDLLEEMMERRWYHTLGVPNAIAAVCVALPFVAHFEINGKDFIKAGGGGLGLLLSLISILLSFRARAGTRLKKAGISVLIMLVAAFHLFSSGFVDLSDREAEAQRYLEEEGLEGITLEGGDGSWTFRAHRGFERCTGSVSIASSMLGGSSSRSSSILCSLPEDLPGLRAACDGGVARACMLAATEIRGQEPIDWTTLVPIYLAACELGDVIGCFEAGVGYDIGRGATADPVRAQGLYRRSCDGDIATACHNLGAMATEGQPPPQDDAAAYRYFSRACELGRHPSCIPTGDRLDAGRGVAADRPRARELYQRACDHEEWEGCMRLGRRYLNGDGIEQDEARALTYYQRACEHRFELGCTLVADMTREGRGMEADTAAALALYRASCERGGAESCQMQGFVLHTGGEGVERDREAAAAAFRRACEGDSRDGCNNLGVYYRDGLGGIERDREQALVHFRRACELGHQGACSQIE